MTHVQLFISAVSAEFRNYRDALLHDLTRPNVSVKVQEDFVATGTETLDMLDEYIDKCDVVIHLVGDMTGAPAQVPSLAMIRQRYPDLGERLPPLAPFLEHNAPALPYTQWEAWLALYHCKPLIIAAPLDGAPRHSDFRHVADQFATQQAHLARLEDVERYPGIHFDSPERLALEIWRGKLFEIFVAAGAARRVIHLPYASLGTLFKGREVALDRLRTSLNEAPANRTAAIVGRAVHGLGGVGKTRLAVEYAWRHSEDYTSVFLIGADSPEALDRNLAALCASTVLDLPEYQVTEEAVQIAAVQGWLQRNPGWLLILDNVDSEPAALAVETLLPRLPGGYLLITSRLSNWSGAVGTLPLGVLAPNDAVEAQTPRADRRPDTGRRDRRRTRLPGLGAGTGRRVYRPTPAEPLRLPGRMARATRQGIGLVRPAPDAVSEERGHHLADIV